MGTDGKTKGGALPLGPAGWLNTEAPAKGTFNQHAPDRRYTINEIAPEKVEQFKQENKDLLFQVGERLAGFVKAGDIESQVLFFDNLRKLMKSAHLEMKSVIEKHLDVQLPD